MKRLVLILFVVNLVLAWGKSFREEIIVSAQYVTRPTNLFVTHHGIKVVTAEGNTYLIHSVPNTGLVVTDAPMSIRWDIKETLKVKGTKTIDGALGSTSAITNVPVINYLTGGTCIKAAKDIKFYLLS